MWATIHPPKDPQIPCIPLKYTNNSIMLAGRRVQEMSLLLGLTESIHILSRWWSMKVRSKRAFLMQGGRHADVYFHGSWQSYLSSMRLFSTCNKICLVFKLFRLVHFSLPHMEMIPLLMISFLLNTEISVSRWLGRLNW